PRAFLQPEGTRIPDSTLHVPDCRITLRAGKGPADDERSTRDGRPRSLAGIRAGGICDHASAFGNETGRADQLLPFNSADLPGAWPGVPSAGKGARRAGDDQPRGVTRKDGP